MAFGVRRCGSIIIYYTDTLHTMSRKAGLGLFAAHAVRSPPVSQYLIYKVSEQSNHESAWDCWKQQPVH